MNNKDKKDFWRILSKECHPGQIIDKSPVMLWAVEGEAYIIKTRRIQCNECGHKYFDSMDTVLFSKAAKDEDVARIQKEANSEYEKWHEEFYDNV